MILIVTATAGLTVITCNAQVTETESHSRANSQGGFDTITRTAEVPRPIPPQPPLAMYDPVLDSNNPLIAINDPTKFGHPKPQPAYNHDGQAFAK